MAGQGPNAHHGPLAPGLRLTASDRPGIAQPVPERDVPPLPWKRMMLVILLIVLLLTAAWEMEMRRRGYEVGDLGSEPSGWAEQRRRLDTENPPVAIVGDSRILFDTDLERFRQMTGVKPVQLALEGTNARPLLEDIADHTRFNGLLIVGITELSYYRPEMGLGKKAFDRFAKESPSEHVSFLLGRTLRRGLAFLDESAALSTMVHHLDRSGRKGAYGPYDDVWKMAITHDDRQYWLWPEIERNKFVRDHAIRMWMIIYSFPGPKPNVIAMTEAKTKAAVAKIRARGGEVVFVRPPSAPALRKLEDERLPRATGWEKLLKAAAVQGVHADDMPVLGDIAIPELSHVSKACAPLFTDAYVRALTRITPRIRLRGDAPPPLTSTACPSRK
ncbi:hypothetical protein BH10PSE13_BH10PSE13_08070 [soil metagenome]